MAKSSVILVCLALAGCGGGGSSAARACDGRPHPAHTRTFLVLFGTLNKMTKTSVCEILGNPNSIATDAHGHPVWVYDHGPRITFQGDRVLAYDDKRRTPIGG